MGAWGSARSGRNTTRRLFGWAFRLAFGGAGLFCLAYGGIDILSHVAYSMNGHRTDANLVAQRTICVLEYQLSNESDLRRDPMACELAEAAVKANSGRHVRVDREIYARVRFSLVDGKVREEETKLSSSNRLSSTMATGSTVPIIYTEANPADFRIALNAARMVELALLMGVGLLVLLFAFLGAGERSSGPKYHIRNGVRPAS